MYRAGVAATAAVLLLVGCSGGSAPTPGPPMSPGTTPPDVVSTEPVPTSTSASAQPSAPPTFSDSATPPSAPTTASPTSSSTDSPPGDLDQLHPWVTARSEEEPRQAAGDWQEIIGVRTGAHEGYDRVVLDLSGDDPLLGWFAGFADEAIEDPTGFPLEIDGDAFLELGIWAIDWTTDRPERFSGPVDADGLDNVTAVAFGGLFEAQQQILIGLEERTAYRVFTLSDPARIVVDIKHAD